MPVYANQIISIYPKISTSGYPPQMPSMVVSLSIYGNPHYQAIYALPDACSRIFFYAFAVGSVALPKVFLGFWVGYGRS